MVNPQMRQVKIKTGMATGLVKEKMMYEKRNKTREKIKKKKKKKAKDCENYPIKKQVEILQESWMILDCQHRLEAAYTDFLQLLKSEKDLQEADEYKETCLVQDLVKLEA
ncbi:tubulin-specific chaperone A-like isoform X1 [Vulpes lagopus]|uniref:tubulin-specific chaperone A-like isoform X1 n=1 Tax=Vulpes lagopus TaxID=494514 RepID=UPI001BC8E572|nr:tubulin-specific chaperone A-like isoform X1 [Vulpes lagopus]